MIIYMQNNCLEGQEITIKQQIVKMIHVKKYDRIFFKDVKFLRFLCQQRIIVIIENA